MFQGKRTPPLLVFGVLSILFALGLLIYASSLAVYAEEPDTSPPTEYTVLPDTVLPPENPGDFESTLSIGEELQHIRQAVEILVYFMLPFSAAFAVLFCFLRWFYRTFILSGLN